MPSANAPDQPPVAGPPEARKPEVGPRETSLPEADKPETGPRDQGSTPVLPVRSLDETDVGWGDRRDPDDDERFRRDRPPHWDAV